MGFAEEFQAQGPGCVSTWTDFKVPKRSNAVHAAS